MKKGYLSIVLICLSLAVWGQQWEWAQAMEQSIHYAQSTGLIKSADGGIITAGIKVLEEDTPRTAAYITKLSSTGNELWTEHINTGTSGEIQVTSLSADAQNNIYVAGTFFESADFNDTVIFSRGHKDFFVVKYSSSGEVIKVFHGGGPGKDQCTAVVTDSQNNFYITGSYNNGAVFLNDTLLHFPGKDDLFLFKVSFSGHTLWQMSLKVDGNACGKSLSVSDDDELMLAAKYRGQFSYDTISMEMYDIYGCNFLMRFNTNMQVEFAKEIDFSPAFITKISGDSQGNILAVVSLDWTSGDRGRIHKLDAQGNNLWSKEFSGGNIYNNGELNDVYVDTEDNFYIIGFHEPGGIPLMVLEKYNMNNQRVWADTTIRYYAKGRGIILDDSGNIVISGYFRDSVFLGAHQLTAFNSQSSFIASHSPVIPLTATGEGIEDIRTGINIYPNPAANVLHVDAANGTITIRDITGRQVYRNEKTSKEQTINLNAFSEGVYIVEVSDGVKRSCKKLIVQR